MLEPLAWPRQMMKNNEHEDDFMDYDEEKKRGMNIIWNRPIDITF